MAQPLRLPRPDYPRLAAEMSGADWVELGDIVGVHGVRGAVKIRSWTRPRENIFNYPIWRLVSESGEQTATLIKGQAQGRGLVAQLKEFNDRDQAAAVRGAKIQISKADLPPPAPGEYYWADLEGLQVQTVAGEDLGTVTGLMETGANDVLVVQGERERLIPFVPELYVKQVDMAAGRLIVDWDATF